MWGWKFKLLSGVNKNYKVTAAFNETTQVIFEILDVVDDPIILRYREDGYIKINYGKPLLLNSADNAFTNKGIKQNPDRIKNKSQYKAVAKVDTLGQIIEIYESVAEANFKNNTDGVSDCFIHSLRRTKGMIFRELDSNGNIIPAPPPPPKKKAERKRGWKMRPEIIQKMMETKRLKKLQPDYIPIVSRFAKKINQYTVDGELVSTHISISSAAKIFNCDSRNFKKQIKKSPRNYYKGFIFKYA